MFKVENQGVYFRSINHMDGGEIPTAEGRPIKYDGCYKLEADVIDPDTRKPTAIIFRIKEDEQGKNLATDLSITEFGTKLLLNFDIVLNRTNQAKLWVTDCVIDR